MKGSILELDRMLSSGIRVQKLSLKTAVTIALLDILGPMTLGNADIRLRDRLDYLLNDGARRFVLSFLRVPWLDCASIGEVVACKQRINQQGGEVKLVMRDRVHDIFTLFELNKVFAIYPDVQSALRSFVEVTA